MFSYGVCFVRKPDSLPMFYEKKNPVFYVTFLENLDNQGHFWAPENEILHKVWTMNQDFERSKPYLTILRFNRYFQVFRLLLNRFLPIKTGSPKKTILFQNFTLSIISRGDHGVVKFLLYALPLARGYKKPD